MRPQALLAFSFTTQKQELLGAQEHYEAELRNESIGGKLAGGGLQLAKGKSLSIFVRGTEYISPE